MAPNEIAQETIITFLNGMNQSVNPFLLNESQYWMASNTTNRDGVVKTRAGFKLLKDLNITGKFQGAFYYEWEDLKQIVFGVDGHVYALDLANLGVTDHGLLLTATSDTFYFVQADKYCIVQDDFYPSTWAAATWPVILDGTAVFNQTALRTSDPENATPKGGPMAYGHGRLFVAVPYIYNEAVWTDNIGLNGFVAGDIIKAYDKTDVLEFTSSNYLDSGGRNILPEELGYITGMGFQRNVLDGVGQGALIIGAERGFSSFQVNAPRDQWKDIDFGVVMFSGTGTRSHRSWIKSNSDIIYRALDGWRSLSASQTKFTGMTLANDPLSSEARDIMRLDTKSSLRFVSGAKDDNRFFLTANPGLNNTFKSLVSFDVAAVSAIDTSTKPIYDGVWTGYDFYQVLLVECDIEDCILTFVRDSDGGIRILEFNEDEYRDESSSIGIKSRVETGYKPFGDPYSRKKFRYAEFYLGDIQGDCTLTAFYRPDGYPYWAKMTSASLKADATGANQKRKVIRLSPVEPPPADAVEKTILDTGFMFQFLIEWTGHLSIGRMRFVSEIQQHEFEPAITETETVKLIPTSTQVEVDHYDYVVS